MIDLVLWSAVGGWGVSSVLFGMAESWLSALKKTYGRDRVEDLLRDTGFQRFSEKFQFGMCIVREAMSQGIAEHLLHELVDDLNGIEKQFQS